MNLNLFHDSRRVFVSARLYIRPIRAVRAPNFWRFAINTRRRAEAEYIRSGVDIA